MGKKKNITHNISLFLATAVLLCAIPGFAASSEETGRLNSTCGSTSAHTQNADAMAKNNFSDIKQIESDGIKSVEITDPGKTEFLPDEIPNISEMDIKVVLKDGAELSTKKDVFWANDYNFGEFDAGASLSVTLDREHGTLTAEARVSGEFETAPVSSEPVKVTVSDLKIEKREILNPDTFLVDNGAYRLTFSDGSTLDLQTLAFDSRQGGEEPGTVRIIRLVPGGLCVLKIRLRQSFWEHKNRRPFLTGEISL